MRLDPMAATARDGVRLGFTQLPREFRRDFSVWAEYPADAPLRRIGCGFNRSLETPLGCAVADAFPKEYAVADIDLVIQS